jgi:ABC-type amino acid transport substrate-binding protein
MKKVMLALSILTVASLLMISADVQAMVPPIQAEKAAYVLREPGKLTIGFTPQAGVAEIIDGKATGFVLVITTKIAERLGLEPVYQPLDFPALVPALQAGRIDVNGAGFSVTQARAQVLYFTAPHFLQPEVLAVLPGTKISSWEEAKDKGWTLATVTGYFQEGEWAKMGLTMHTFDSVDACFMDVLNGGATGCGVGAYDLIYRRATQPDSPVNKLENIIMSGPRIIADLNATNVSKDNPALARDIAKVVAQLWREGEIEQAYKDIFKDAPYDIFMTYPQGEAAYYPGPWEAGATPPASDVYPTVKTLSAGELTVGVAGATPMLKLDGDKLSGPEATILQFAADKLGLTLKGVAVTDGAAAVRDGKVDVLAGAVPATEEASHQYWQSMPIGFNPDYIYVAPGEDGGFPGYTSWEDVQAAKGKLAAIAGNPRIADMKKAGADVLEVPDAAAGLQALVDKTAAGFVGTTLDYAVATSSDPKLADAGIGWVRNTDLYTYGEAYIWGVKAGNGDLLDALDQAITAAWQQNAIAGAYRPVFPGANITALLAPGPTAIGTSYAASKDYLWRSMWLPGPWLQRPGWVK